MKKIVCFISSLASGGAEHQLAILANLLFEKGYDITFVTCMDEPDYYKLNDRIKRVKIPTHNSNVVSGLKTIRYFSKVDCDCIISFRERMNLVVLIGTWFRKGIRVVAGERNLTVGKPSNVGMLNQQLFYKRADYIVANSGAQEDYLKMLGKSWSKKVSSIINYTDLDVYKPSLEPADDNIIKIGIFARFSPQKNCKRFLEMIAQLKKINKKAFQIVWFGHKFGEANVQFYNDFCGYVERLGVGDVVKTHDPVKNVNEWMDKFHAIALPSLFEGFSNAVSEGICAGKPMLVSLVSDNGKMVKDGENGFTFCPTDTAEMLSAFDSFLNLTKEERLAMGKRSREIAESLFDSERFVNGYIRLIES